VTSSTNSRRPARPWRAHRRHLGLLGLAALVAGSLVACSSESGSGAFADPDSSSSTQVRLVQQPWEDLIVENQISSQILDALGYQVKVNELSVPLGAQALAQSQADAYLGNWWPSQKPTFQKYLDQGKVTQVGTILTGTQYAPVVPKYVADKYDIHSLADLDEHADLFDHKFLGIEPGTPGNQYILDAIKEDAYGLGDWELVQSSTPGMLAEVTRDAKKQTPVVFLGWSPHWMNVQWGLVYLEDPEHVWPGAGEIRVLVRDGLESDDPNLARYFSQMNVETDTASAWINDLGQKKMAAEAVASAWIKDNEDTIATWLEGVESVDGKPAADVVRDKLGS
jgi:glycine betaine/proline transport system substrate-binding protein